MREEFLKENNTLNDNRFCRLLTKISNEGCKIDEYKYKDNSKRDVNNFLDYIIPVDYDRFNNLKEILDNRTIEENIENIRIEEE